MSLELVALLGVICFVLVMGLLNPSKWVFAHSPMT